MVTDRRWRQCGVIMVCRAMPALPANGGEFVMASPLGCAVPSRGTVWLRFLRIGLAARRLCRGAGWRCHVTGPVARGTR